MGPFVDAGPTTPELVKLYSVCFNGQAKENLPGGSLKYQFVYLEYRIDTNNDIRKKIVTIVTVYNDI